MAMAIYNKCLFGSLTLVYRYICVQNAISSEFCSDEANHATKVFGISQMDGIGKDAERDTLSGFPLTEEEQLLAVGATIANEIREAIREQLQFTCSTGIATNKLLAKLVSPLNKPDGQTVSLVLRVAGGFQ